MLRARQPCRAFLLSGSKPIHDPFSRTAARTHPALAAGAHAVQHYTEEVSPLYSKVRCQTLVLWGEDGQWIPAERGRLLQRTIRGAQLQVIPNAGHLVQEDAPEAIVAALLRLLSGKRGWPVVSTQDGSLTLP
ncbi:alpha/beta fold hydrolase [Paraburkholderia silvatlantica]|uniref:alpha/beta fold hydrolase n=1 Tax=Paraburkholderia silvatlantica TaxID=321895 RepID=UPI000D76AA13|nr:alpha/beta hydrolase [Paraburkholderia silvatlantica]